MLYILLSLREKVLSDFTQSVEIVAPHLIVDLIAITIIPFHTWT